MPHVVPILKSPQAASGAHLIALCSRQDLQEFPPSKPTQVIKPCLFKFNHQGIRRMNSGPRPQVKSSASTATPRRTSAQPQVTLMLAISCNTLLIASRISVKRRQWKFKSGPRAGRGDLEVKGSRSWCARKDEKAVKSQTCKDADASHPQCLLKAQNAPEGCGQLDRTPRGPYTCPPIPEKPCQQWQEFRQNSLQ
ncbi:hypothetical protein B0H10DRAFT_2197029 [Mycena sp. CBHHK59/15]|nr:hypothetical protein B0H10DRAFT_2197029 [Mycena sp. CBHHK59/15]